MYVLRISTLKSVQNENGGSVKKPLSKKKLNTNMAMEEEPTVVAGQHDPHKNDKVRVKVTNRRGLPTAVGVTVSTATSVGGGPVNKEHQKNCHSTSTDEDERLEIYE